MKPSSYVPERGDVVWFSFDPQAGREQAGRRPALVLSPASYNGKTSLALVCPITSKAKGYPFESPLPNEMPVRGVVLSDHVRSLDWRSRRAERICSVPDSLLEDVLAKVAALLGSA